LLLSPRLYDRRTPAQQSACAKSRRPTAGGEQLVQSRETDAEVLSDDALVPGLLKTRRCHSHVLLDRPGQLFLIGTYL
jgi:hypothetical protein